MNSDGWYAFLRMICSYRSHGWLMCFLKIYNKNVFLLYVHSDIDIKRSEPLWFPANMTIVWCTASLFVCCLFMLMEKSTAFHSCKTHLLRPVRTSTGLRAEHLPRESITVLRNCSHNTVSHRHSCVDLQSLWMNVFLEFTVSWEESFRRLMRD